MSCPGLERAAGRDESGGDPSADAGRGCRVRVQAPQADLHQAGNHRPVAGERPERHPGFRRGGPPGYRVHRPMELVAGRQDPDEDVPGIAGAERGVLIRLFL